MRASRSAGDFDVEWELARSDAGFANADAFLISALGSPLAQTLRNADASQISMTRSPEQFPHRSAH